MRDQNRKHFSSEKVLCILLLTSKKSQATNLSQMLASVIYFVEHDGIAPL